MDCSKYQPSVALTVDLWAEIFARTGAQQISFSPWSNIEARKHEQQQLHQLRPVCKQFSEVFKSHPQCLQWLTLDEAFPSSSLPSLLAWVQHSKGSLQILEANCGSLVDAVLGALMSSTSMLKLIDIAKPETLVQSSCYQPSVPWKCVP